MLVVKLTVQSKNESKQEHILDIITNNDDLRKNCTMSVTIYLNVFQTELIELNLLYK